MSERLLQYLKDFGLEELKILRDTNTRLAKQHRDNADRMDETVQVMDDEIDRRTHGSVLCPECRHRWESHESEMKWNDDLTLVECSAHMGMGNWCGCKRRIPYVLDS